MLHGYVSSDIVCTLICIVPKKLAEHYCNWFETGEYTVYAKSKESNVLAARVGEVGLLVRAIALAFPPQLTCGITCQST